MGVITYTDRLKKRMPYEGQENWKDERDIDDHIDDVVVGALLTANRVISGGAVSAGTGLNADYTDMQVRVAGTTYTITAGSIALTAAQPGQELVNWIYISDTGTVTAAIVPPTGDYIPLALVDTSDTAIIRIGDLRPIAPEVEGVVENDCINGTFDIWQRGTSQTVAGYGSDDRWRLDLNGSTATNSRQSFAAGQTDVPGNPAYYASVAVTSVAGTSNYVLKAQRIIDVRRYSGKRVCVKFHARASATLGLAVNLSQEFGSGGSASVAISGQKVSLSTSWAKFVLYFDIPSISGKTIGTTPSYTQINFWFDAGSDLNVQTDTLGQQSGTFDIAEVEIFESDRELPVKRRLKNETLHECLPFYQKSYLDSVAPGTASGGGRHESYAHNTWLLNHCTVNLQKPMIMAPSITLYNPITGVAGVIRDLTINADLSGTAVALISNKSFEHSGQNLLTSQYLYAFHWAAEAEL